MACPDCERFPMRAFLYGLAIGIAFALFLVTLAGCSPQRDITRPQRGVTGDPGTNVVPAITGRWIDRLQSAALLEFSQPYDSTTYGASVTVTGFELWEKWSSDGKIPDGTRHTVGAVWRGEWIDWHFYPIEVESLLPPSICVTPQWTITLMFVPEYEDGFGIKADAFIGQAVCTLEGGPWANHVYIVPLHLTRDEP